MSANLKRLFRVVRDSGISGIAGRLRDEYGMPIHVSNKMRWRTGIPYERDFWHSYFEKTIIPQGDAYPRLRTDTALQDRVVSLLPAEQETVRILDVGAGPLTYLGKTCRGRTICITPVDPLAEQYDRILAEYSITPPVRTTKGEAERLTSQFGENSFDLVYARNCIDHSYDPEMAIGEMIGVCRPNCYVLLEHHPNEGKAGEYSGLHQWDFSVDESGNSIVGSRTRAVNMTEKLNHRCSITCEILHGQEEWVIARIRKHES